VIKPLILQPSDGVQSRVHAINLTALYLDALTKAPSRQGG